MSLSSDPVSSFFSNFKPKPERRIEVAKVKEKRSLFGPFLVGFIVCGSGASLPALAQGDFNPWEAGATATLGGMTGLIVAAVSRQPGSSEALLHIIEASDDMRESATRLEGSLELTHQKLGGQQGVAVELRNNMAKLSTEVRQAHREIGDFGSKIARMSTAMTSPASSPPYPQTDEGIPASEQVYPQAQRTGQTGPHFQPEEEAQRTGPHFQPEEEAQVLRPQRISLERPETHRVPQPINQQGQFEDDLQEVTADEWTRDAQ